MTVRAAGGATTRQASLRRTAFIRRLDDPAAVRARLKTAAAYAAYALAYLDPRFFHLADFYEAVAGEKTGLIMHARGGLGPSTLTLGDPGLVGALLKLHPGPRQTFLTSETEHVDSLLTAHDLWRPQSMVRMQLQRQHFTTPESISTVRRLVEADAGDLNRLYAIEEDGLRYSGRQVVEGVYYGAHNRGRLVAAAGTHIYSNHEGVGVIGNVFTHPDFRSRGLGSAVTAAVASHLLRSCNLVVLNVDPANRTARHIYQQLGFKDTGRLVEAMATRHDAMSPLPLIRRTLARWRAHQPQTEVIEL
ncbi:MAG TPA: GNAT family N-acetyltransferase [Dehalococcoidia bacterium]|nr:GNAT family N-acetyltransferase [Dehalococcoidia bacterium]